MLEDGPETLAEEIRGMGAEIDVIEEGLDRYSNGASDDDLGEMRQRCIVFGFNISNIHTRLLRTANMVQPAALFGLSEQERNEYLKIQRMIQNQQDRIRTLLASLEIHFQR